MFLSQTNNPMPMERLLLAGFVLLNLISACTEENQVQQAALDSLKAKPVSRFVEVPPWIGIYQDTLPCPDCKGMLTRLEFKTDTSYKKSVTLLGKGEVMSNTFSTLGRWKWLRKEGLLVLDSSQEKKLLVFRIEGDSALRMCDLANKPLASDRYLLQRL